MDNKKLDEELDASIFCVVKDNAPSHYRVKETAEEEEELKN